MSEPFCPICQGKGCDLCRDPEPRKEYQHPQEATASRAPIQIDRWSIDANGGRRDSLGDWVPYAQHDQVVRLLLAEHKAMQQLAAEMQKSPLELVGDVPHSDGWWTGFASATRLWRNKVNTLLGNKS